MKNIEIEKDPELENLIAKCKKKGLKFGLALGRVVQPPGEWLISESFKPLKLIISLLI